MPTISDIEEIIVPISDPNEAYVTSRDIYYERVRFAFLHIKKYPEFYKRGQTPFLHRSLYSEHTPQVIEDVLSACALYCGKNVANETLVYRDIGRKAWDLAGRNILLQRPLDMLTYTQALLLYQIIRLFDGDIRQRADAESHERVLKDWTEQLQTRFQALPSIASSASSLSEAITSSSWKDWIYQESCRRTVLASYMLQGVYSFLKSGYDNVSCKVNNLSFTAQATLWNAPLGYHWREVCKEKKHFKVTIREWDIAMESVQLNDLDELGVVILAGLKPWISRANGLEENILSGGDWIGDLRITNQLLCVIEAHPTDSEITLTR
jgi:hypothetical protein